MSYYDRIQACNTYDATAFRPFRVGGDRVGWVRHEFAAELARWPEVFRVQAEWVALVPALRSFEERSLAVQEVIRALIDSGSIARWHGEKYPVTASSRDKALFWVDRSAAAYFGIRAFGQHMNGYVPTDDGLCMWLGRRAKTKWSEPGKLDNMVAGGLPHAADLPGNLAKECWEEAAIPHTLAAQAVSTGAISYCRQAKEGLKPDLIYCYDLELPAEFVPQCTDGEVDAFYLWPIEKVAEVVRETEAVKRNCNLVIIDFLIRHGHIKPDEPDYPELVSGLHR